MCPLQIRERLPGHFCEGHLGLPCARHSQVTGAITVRTSRLTNKKNKNIPVKEKKKGRA